MKKQDLKFLVDLHTGIGRGCEILDVGRESLLSTLQQFFETVSLGIELGLRMKKGKPVPASFAKKPAGPKLKGASTFSTVLAEIIGKQTLSLSDIEAALVKSKKAPKSNNLRGYLSTTLATAKNGKRRIFKSHERGHYFVAANAAKARAASTTKKPKIKTTKADFDRSPKVLKGLIATLGRNGSMSLGDLTKANKHLLQGLKDPSKTVWTIISKSSEIEHTSKPGFYRLKVNGKSGKTTGKTATEKSTPAAAPN